jgi:hydroxyacylglutathione hydrolase
MRIGRLRIDVVHTPGHTPEHIGFLVIDEPVSPRPLCALTGDFLFVGDVGRPDLLERAAKVANTMEAGGRQLYSSIQKFARYDDGLLIWPGHGAGSACGKSLGGAPCSTLGYERSANWALRPQTEEAFVSEVLRGQPEPPPYFAQMKKLNQQGPSLLGGFKLPSRLSAAEMESLARGLAQVVDIRDRHVTKHAFLSGALLIPENGSFLKYAGWLLDYERPIFLIAEDEAQALEAVRDLALIGLDSVAGWIPAGEVRHSGQVTAIRGNELDKWRGTVLDVRWPDEYAQWARSRGDQRPAWPPDGPAG